MTAVTAPAAQPDWAALEASAASLIASDPLAPEIAQVTPAGGHVAIDLRASLDDVVAAATAKRPLDGPLVVTVDTLVVPAGTTVVPAAALTILARSIDVGGDAATLQVGAGGPALGVQVTTAGIDGTLSVDLKDGRPAAPLALEGAQAPQVLTAEPGKAATATADAAAVADVLHEPWAIVALELSASTAASLLDQDVPDLAGAMLQWVVGGCSALLAQRAQYPGVDFVNVASIQTSAVALLAFSQAAASDAVYVPVLSADAYQSLITPLLDVAATYDAKIAALQQTQDLDKQLAAFAQTLTDVYGQAQTPLLNSLKRLASESGALEQQLANAAAQLDEVASTLPALQEALVKAIDDKFQEELVSTAVDVLFKLAMLYIGVGMLLIDPELAAGEAVAVAKAAADAAKQFIEGGKSIAEIIQKGMPDPSSAPSAGAAEAAKNGGEALAGSLVSFGTAINTLWGVVSVIGSDPGKLTPQLVAAAEQMPNLSGFSVGGLDPAAYWQAVVAQTRASLAPNKDMPEAVAYLEAVELAQTYGTSVADLQMKLLGLYTQGMNAFDQLLAAQRAQASWATLQSSLASSADRAAAASGLLQRGYLNVKRQLVDAVENYRAAFFYQWLQAAPVHVDVTMSLTALKQAAANSVSGLAAVLAGSGTVRPRQDFSHVEVTIPATGAFAVVDGEGQVQFTIRPEDIAGQLNDDTALFLTSATFQLMGGQQPAEVELTIANSGHYSNQLGDTVYRFVSQPVSMKNSYRPSPLKWVTRWKFADAAAYLKPTPYTGWTLRVNAGDWQGAAGILVTLSGTLLQNP